MAKKNPSVTSTNIPNEMRKKAQKQRPDLYEVNGGNHTCWKIPGYGKTAVCHKGQENLPMPNHILRNTLAWLAGAGITVLIVMVLMGSFTQA